MIFNGVCALAQIGRTPGSAKPSKGFGGSGVLELVENDGAGTYRAVYTVNCTLFRRSRKEELKRHEIEMVKQRLKIAQDDNKARKKTVK
jgi:phage-related protein